MLCVGCGQPGADAFSEGSDWFHRLCYAKALTDGDVPWPEAQAVWTQEKAEGYLAALIDGEGNVHKSVIRVYNSDPTLVSATASVLRYLGIPYRVTVRQRRGNQPEFTVSLLGGLHTAERLLSMPINSYKRERLLERTRSYRCRNKGTRNTVF